MDRFERYGIYLMAWGRGAAPMAPVAPPDPAFAVAAAASGIGCYQHARKMRLMSLDELDRFFESIETPPGERESAAARTIAAVEEDLALTRAGAAEMRRDRDEALEQARAHIELYESRERDIRQAREALEQARAVNDGLREVDREVRAALGATPDESTPAAARRVMSAVPDVGPSFRDERERQDAHDRLRALIAAGGATETGDRWLYDAAADEIVRLRDKLRIAAEVAQKEEAHDDGLFLKLRRELRAARAELGAREGETLIDAARRVADALMQEIRDNVSRADIVKAREQGAAEMRERAADTVQRMKNAIKDIMARTGLQDAVNAIRALPLSTAPEDHVAHLVRKAASGRGLDAVRADIAASDRLSAEDAETLREAGWTLRLEIWYSPAISEDYDPEIACDLESLRSYAARHRAAKVPPAPHGVTGEAPGGDRAAGGKRSVAEAQGEKQGAPDEGPAERAVALLHRASWHKTAERLAAGEYTPQRALDKLRHYAGDVPADADDREAMAALEALIAAPAAPAALPKPPRVEVGQRWVHADWITREEVVHVEADCVTFEDGTVTASAREMLTSDEWTFLGTTPQGPSPKREDEPVFVPDQVDIYGDPTPRGAYVVGPVTRGSAEPTDGPTARDAVAGMLLRCGWVALAHHVARGHSIDEAMVRLREGAAAVVPKRTDRVCIAALEAPSAVEGFRVMLRDAARAAVKPPHNADQGALGGVVDAELVVDLVLRWLRGAEYFKRGAVPDGQATDRGAYNAGQRDALERCARNLCRAAGVEAPTVEGEATDPTRGTTR